MNDPLFDHALRRDIARLADAMEGLLAYLVGATPTLAATPPADFNGAQYAFDATSSSAAPVEPAPTSRRWTYWSKVDPRSRELAELATAAGKREKAAKTPATRETAKTEKNKYLYESKARQRRLRQWLAEDKGIIDGNALYYFAADGTKTKWVPSPSPHFFLPG